MKKSLNIILATAVATALAIPAFSADVTMRISLQLPMKVIWDKISCYSKNK